MNESLYYWFHFYFRSEERYEEHMVAMTGLSVRIGREMIEKFLQDELIRISNEAIVDEVQRRKKQLDQMKHKIISARTSRLLKRFVSVDVLTDSNCSNVVSVAQWLAC